VESEPNTLFEASEPFFLANCVFGRDSSSPSRIQCLGRQSPFSWQTVFLAETRRVRAEYTFRGVLALFPGKLCFWPRLVESEPNTLFEASKPFFPANCVFGRDSSSPSRIHFLRRQSPFSRQTVFLAETRRV